VAITFIEGIIEHHIAQRLRQLRHDRNLTLQQLSEATGFSKGLLSKIENCIVSPPIGTLSKLAQALEVHIGEFFDTNDNQPGRVYFPKEKRKRVQSRRSSLNYQYDLLAPGKKRRDMQPMLVTIEGRTSGFGLQQHPGQQFIFMLEGEMQYVVGNDSYDVRPEDVLYFDARIPHGPRLNKNQRACYIVVHTSEERG
jgi:transcriptional regulator with XRE-family HTH domain